jgi:hypothetical protein
LWLVTQLVSKFLQLFAALKEWGTGEHKHYDFTANMNADAYDGHILSLNKIEAAQNGFYHRMMADIYHLASYVPPSHPQAHITQIS